MQPFGVLQVNLKYVTLVATVCQIVFQVLASCSDNHSKLPVRRYCDIAQPYKLYSSIHVHVIYFDGAKLL